MTHISWIITSLLLSLLVGLTVGCSKLSNGNWMKKIGDVRNEDGWGKRSDRTQGQRLSQMAELSRRVRNRRNQGGSIEDHYDSFSSSVSMDGNAIYPEPPGPEPRPIQDQVQRPIHDQVQAREDREKIFLAADADGDGVVSLEEFRESPGYENDDPFTMQYDKNKDGVVTMAEFLPAAEFHEEEMSENICSSPKYQGDRCEDCLMEVCDFKFINATQCAGEDMSPDSICNSFQVYIDCIARESWGCPAKNFTNKILYIASGLKGDGECPQLYLAALRRPDYVLPRSDIFSPDRSSGELQELPGRQDEPVWPQPLLPMYGSGNKQEDFDRGGFRYPFDPLEYFTDPDMIFPGDVTDTESSASYSNIEDSKSNKQKDRPVRTQETSTVKELLQLQNDDRDSQLISDNAQSATPSWLFTTQRAHHRHRHHHTSRQTSHLQTQSTEQLQPLHIRQVRSSTTKRRPIEKSRSRSRSSNCKVSTIWPCNQAFISALAQGVEDPCESLVRLRHCVHKSTRHCTDTNVYKINEGLKYLSKEHRRAKLCGQIRIVL